jgi:hypothetical protein
MSASTVDLDDIQGLLRFGYKHQTQASFLLLQVKDSEAARAWLGSVPVNSAASVEPPPETALQLALSCAGLQALGVAEDIVMLFQQSLYLGWAVTAARRAASAMSGLTRQSAGSGVRASACRMCW